MLMMCERCEQFYDDARASTICPHHPLMSDADLARKDAGIALLGKVVRFAHEADSGLNYAVVSCGWNGMVYLQGQEGWFAPDLFVVVERQVNIDWIPPTDPRYEPPPMRVSRGWLIGSRILVVVGAPLVLSAGLVLEGRWLWGDLAQAWRHGIGNAG